MGIREDQFPGLNKWAEAFVAGEQKLAYIAKLKKIYPDGREEQAPDQEIYASTIKKEEDGRYYTGMFGTEYALHQYIFPDGKVYKEYVQEEPWSSGPCFFLALKDEEGRSVAESLWTEDEVDSY